MTRRPPLDAWFSRKIGLSPDRGLDHEALSRYQLSALNRTLSHVRQRSVFYREHLSGTPEALDSLETLAVLPFTTDAQIRRAPLSFLCVSQAQIARAVTLESSGTTGGPKRIFFTEADLELTVDFFHHGMATLVSPGARVLILMPGTLPGSVGALLGQALARMGAHGTVHGPVRDPAAAVKAALAEGATAMVGLPAQVLAMTCQASGERLAGRIQTVLLSADYVPDAVATRIEKAWGCRVCTHYGMTEMGLGGGLAGAACSGYHFREADLLMEIVDPGTGQRLPDGKPGELVFTTLTREGMPLVRYRTGDRAEFKVDSCPCGTVLSTLGAIRGRIGDDIRVDGGSIFSIGDLDDAVFAIPDVRNFNAVMDEDGGIDRLTLWVDFREGTSFRPVAERVRDALDRVPAIGGAVGCGRLGVFVKPADRPMTVSTGTGKRRIRDYRKKG